MNGHPCENCRLWPECNGAACPNAPKEQPQQVVPAYLDDHTESGLLDE